MENTVDTICRQLAEKKDMFLAYEEATKELLNCTPDAAEHYIIERSKLANKIDQLNEEIGRTCDQNPNSRMLYDAAMVKTEYGNIPVEMQPVYQAGQQVRSVISRIQELDKLVMERLVSFQEDARAKIQENQNLPKIKKYLSDLSSEQPEAGGLKSDKV